MSIDRYRNRSNRGKFETELCKKSLKTRKYCRMCTTTLESTCALGIHYLSVHGIVYCDDCYCTDGLFMFIPLFSLILHRPFIHVICFILCRPFICVICLIVFRPFIPLFSLILHRPFISVICFLLNCKIFSFCFTCISCRYMPLRQNIVSTYMQLAQLLPIPHRAKKMKIVLEKMKMYLCMNLRQSR